MRAVASHVASWQTFELWHAALVQAICTCKTSGALLSIQPTSSVPCPTQNDHAQKVEARRALRSLGLALTQAKDFPNSVFRRMQRRKAAQQAAKEKELLSLESIAAGRRTHAFASVWHCQNLLALWKWELRQWQATSVMIQRQ